MNVKFYRSNNNKENVVRAVFARNSKTCFSATQKEIGGIPIFKDGSSKTIKILLEECNEKLVNIAKKQSTEMILACSEDFLKKVIRATQEHEIEVNVLITETRELLHYLCINLEPEEGENKIVTVMLVSYND